MWSSAPVVGSNQMQHKFPFIIGNAKFRSGGQFIQRTELMSVFRLQPNTGIAPRLRPPDVWSVMVAEHRLKHQSFLSFVMKMSGNSQAFVEGIAKSQPVESPLQLRFDVPHVPMRSTGFFDVTSPACRLANHRTMLGSSSSSSAGTTKLNTS